MNTLTNKAGRVFSRPVAFGLFASTFLTLLASSSAPTPLYAIYQAKWGFSDVTMTVIFGVYAIAVLSALLIFGSLSDHIGRRPVLAAALLSQTLVMLLFAFAGNLELLLAARVLQGLATGAAIGAIGAVLVDLQPGHGAVANAASGVAGTASGALGSALLVQLLPAPTKLIYLVLCGLFLAQALAIRFTTETSPRRPGALKALKPVLAVPDNVRGALLIATPSLVAVWALAGFYGSLGPSLAGFIAQSNSALLGGLAMFVLAGSGAVTIVATRLVQPRRLAIVGNATVMVGVATVLWAVADRSVALFFIGTAVAGTGFGGGFQGSMRTIVPLVSAHERAGVLSVAYLICYLAMGLPAIGAGVLVVHSTLSHTATAFGIGVIALAGLTASGMALAARRDGREVTTKRRLSAGAAIGRAA